MHTRICELTPLGMRCKGDGVVKQKKDIHLRGATTQTYHRATQRTATKQCGQP